MHSGRLLNAGEKRLLVGATAIGVLALLFLGGWFLTAHRLTIPAAGGSYTEALVGSPQFVNPLYAPANDADADLSRLVFSGLVRWDQQKGFVNDLASNISVSADGKTYTVTLRSDAKFQNGDPVSPQDVLYTFGALKDPLYRSPLSPIYQDVDVSQVDDHTVTFTLNAPDSYFLSRLTVGILPSNVWSAVAPGNMPLAEFNLKPIGSGPYAFKNFTRDQNGNIISYTLVANNEYYGTKPNIGTLTFKFYPDADTAVKALESRNVEGVAYVPQNLEAEAQKTNAVQLLRPLLPRQTVLIFNQQRQVVFQNQAVRQAVALALDRQAILEAAVNGEGVPIAGPVLAEALNGAEPAIPTPDVTQANALLDKAGFTKGADGTRVSTVFVPKSEQTSTNSTNHPFSFTLTTVQDPEFLQAAQTIAQELSTIGFSVQIIAVPSDQFDQTVLQPRNFDLLLTGISYGDDPDPSPYWDSTEATPSGLNLANYTSTAADAALTQARATQDPVARAKDYLTFEQTVLADVPAVFLYRPTYTYAVGNKVHGVTLSDITSPSDRFWNIEDWYVKTKEELK